MLKRIEYVVVEIAKKNGLPTIELELAAKFEEHPLDKDEMADDGDEMIDFVPKPGE